MPTDARIEGVGPKMVLDYQTDTVHTGTRENQGIRKPARFVDLFAGCGGLSLGLMESGWSGLFAIERDRDAFSTFRHNLVERQGNSFTWPDWLPISEMDVQTFVEDYQKRLENLRGCVELIAAGPPCQGFSVAGRRQEDDPRNQAFWHYISTVQLLEPPLLLFENVPGIRAKFADSTDSRPFSVQIKEYLDDQCGYLVFDDVVKAVDFGVAQLRPRHIMIGIKKSLLEEDGGKLSDLDPFELLREKRKEFLHSKRLEENHKVTVKEAISDLETVGNGKLIACEDTSGFQQMKYGTSKTDYQRMLHGDLNGASPNSLRLVNHRPDTVKRFRYLIQTCPKGINLSSDLRHKYGIRKSSIKILDESKPSPTLTTLPDDLIHYSEPRILTVRENARLQSFPDWFEFKGKYTTGGDRRTHECPRYTQVANAVPPLLAEALGDTLLAILARLSAGRAFHESHGLIEG